MQLAFMRALWDLGEATASRVQEKLLELGHEFAPTTVATVLRRMEKKQLVAFEKRGRVLVYRAAVDRAEMTASAFSRLSDALYGGNVGALLSQLVSSEQVTPDDLETIDNLIKAKEKDASQ